MLRTLLTTLVALTSVVTAQDNPLPLTCTDGVQLIAVVGTNVANGTQSYGLTVTFVQKLMAAIPNSFNYSMNYNRFHLANESSTHFLPEVEEGTPRLHGLLVNYTTACPNTPIVLHGYSEGAVVVMNELCGTNQPFPYPFASPMAASYASHIIGVILYGDETRTANESYNLGGCNSNAPHLARVNQPGGCKSFAPSMQSYCFANDADCCGTANASAPYPYGINPHYLYPSGFDNDAVNFVVKNYYKYGNGTWDVPPPSSSTSKPTGTTLKSTTSTPKPTTTSTKSTTSSVVPTTTTVPPTSATSTKTPHPTLNIQPSCSTSIDACLLSFANHPMTASHFCSNLAISKATATPFPTACAGVYTSRYSSACDCLIIPTSSTSSKPAAATGPAHRVKTKVTKPKTTAAGTTPPAFSSKALPPLPTTSILDPKCLVGYGQIHAEPPTL